MKILSCLVLLIAILLICACSDDTEEIDASIGDAQAVDVLELDLVTIEAQPSDSALPAPEATTGD